MKLKASQIIEHRVNKLDASIANNIYGGIEIDVRAYGNKIICSHDPFLDGEELSKILDLYKNKKIIVNLKETGLVEFIESRYNSKNELDLIYLDTGTPEIENTNIHKKTFLRISEFEKYNETQFTKKFEWIWLDSFNTFWFDKKFFKELLTKYKICLVSPELQSKNVDSISDFKQHLFDYQLTPDLVCTKNPESWL